MGAPESTKTTPSEVSGRACSAAGSSTLWAPSRLTRRYYTNMYFPRTRRYDAHGGDDERHPSLAHWMDATRHWHIAGVTTAPLPHKSERPEISILRRESSSYTSMT